MNRTLYLEGSGGIAGDMLIAALLDLGANQKKLDEALAPLRKEGVTYTISQKSSYGLRGCDFEVNLPHDHHDHDHHPPHTHDDDHTNAHATHSHTHTHRNPAEVEAVLDSLPMSDKARAFAKKVFAIVAEAEAKAHGCPVEAVHFHEVGALDSIADIAGAAVLLDDLGVDRCIVTKLGEGSGTVHCQHGDLPVPVPAVLNIAEAHHIQLAIHPDVKGEMVTPTGIALAAALRTSDHLPPEFSVLGTGIGLGKRDFGRANLLRVMWISDDASQGAENDSERIILLECNLDDSSGERLGLAMEELFQAGARDVHFLPCFMKKNRPGYLLRIIADAKLQSTMEEVLFRTTTTIGVRIFPVERTRMTRQIRTVALPCGSVAVKECRFGELVKHYPEYESVKALAAKTRIPFQELFEAAQLAAEKSDDSTN
ncbi:MAG: nickel pincer cofactor biosynthesis protein LarC [Victivallaceae bacterium]|nr:nickel pincer cofactor biosynthesis protein LarC [Victivallaceae bacterium]